MVTNVLVEHIVSIDHGLDYANKANRPEIWSRLVKVQLDSPQIKDSISNWFIMSIVDTAFLDLYIKAEDPSNFAKVIEISSHVGKHDDLVHFFQMACRSFWEPKIDMDLAYTYAKTNCLHDMADFLGMMNVTGILKVGEKCFKDELYLGYSSPAFPTGLATTLI